MIKTFAVIVGQGLAGTAVGWELLRRDLPFIVFDGGESDSSSRIAAGLVTPVTGKRGVLTWSWWKAWQIAQAHYQACESAAHASFWYPTQALRLFDSQDESDYLSARFAKQSDLPIETYPLETQRLDCRYYRNEFSGFVMPVSAQLDTACYLEASRKCFAETFRERLDLATDVLPCDNGWRLPRFDIECRCLIFAQGFMGGKNPWFLTMPLVPSQGDILSLEAPLDETRTIHRQVWLARDRRTSVEIADTTRKGSRADAGGSSEPIMSEDFQASAVFNTHGSSIGDRGSTPLNVGRYLVGSTYRWHRLGGVPQFEDRAEIEAKLQRWLKVPYRVIDHRSGIRPSSYGQRPLLGASPMARGCYCINGLGAKGVLYAPWMASILVETIVNDAPLPREFTWTSQ